MNNEERADKALKMLFAFYYNADMQGDMTDALTDLIHLMHREHIIPINMFIRCQDIWMEEVAEAEQMADSTANIPVASPDLISSNGSMWDFKTVAEPRPSMPYIAPTTEADSTSECPLKTECSVDIYNRDTWTAPEADYIDKNGTMLEFKTEPK